MTAYETQKITDKLLFDFPAKKTDVAVLFGAGSISGSIAREAANLYHAGAFENIILTGGKRVFQPHVYLALRKHFRGKADPELTCPSIKDFFSVATEADYMERILLDADVPQKAIIFKDDKSEHTGANVANIKDVLLDRRHSVQSASLITVAYHQRRAMGTVSIHEDLNHVSLVPVSVYPFGFTKTNWHKTPIKPLVELEHHRITAGHPLTYVGEHCIDPSINAERQRAKKLPDISL